MKKVLITGANSYIGTNVYNWLTSEKYKNMYSVDVLDMLDEKWSEKDFSQYDSVYHVAGIAHADITNVSEEQKKLYYDVNCELAVRVACKAKNEGVKQFIYMSSLLVYGDAGNGSYKNKRYIDKETKPAPSNFYGDSKWQAELKLSKLIDNDFNIATLRPPMIYGKGCKGNYNQLVKIARKVPVFPDINNKRSVLYIDNLCEFVRLLIDSCEGGVYWPQNREQVKTSDFIREIAEVRGRKIHISSIYNFFVKIASVFHGKIGRMVNKAFGSLSVASDLSYEFDGKYQVYSFEESIRRIEKE